MSQPMPALAGSRAGAIFRGAPKIIRERLRWMALFADLPPAAQITRFEAGILGDSRQHPGTNLLAIMECKDIVRVVCMFKSLVRSWLTLDSPHNGLQGC